MATEKHTSLVRRLFKNKPAATAMVFLCLLLLMALLAPFIANHKPYYITYKGQTFYPLFTQAKQYELTDPKTGQLIILDIENVDWKWLDYDDALWPPIAYSPGLSDLTNANYTSPGAKQTLHKESGQTIDLPGGLRHKLGTGLRGDDVFAGLIHGSRISLKVGFISMLIAAILGIILGLLAGYYGNNGLKVQRGSLWVFYLSLLPAWFYSFYLNSSALSLALKESIFELLYKSGLCLALFMLIALSISWGLGRLLAFIPFFKKPVAVPVDSWITRTIETVISIPGIILIIAIAAITNQLLGVIILVIGLTGWTGIARLIRAEMLRIRELDYIIAAKAAGLKHWAIIFRHALPNAIQPALVSMVFGVASAILIESGLSFLGAFQVGDVTWGSMLAEGRNNFNAWWLVVYPGLAIFLTVTSLNLLGEALRDELDVR